MRPAQHNCVPRQEVPSLTHMASEVLSASQMARISARESRRHTSRAAIPNSSMYTKSAVLNWKVTFSSWVPY